MGQFEEKPTSDDGKVIGNPEAPTGIVVIPPPPPPPDGGLKAWLQILGAHLMIFNSWGYIVSFGIFQTTYIEFLHQTPSAISWIGSIQIFLTFFVGTWSGRALDIGKFHHVFIAGSILQVFSVLMTSLCTKYWQLLLAQGIGSGLADGLMFCPTIALASTYFHRNRAIAIGMVASGTATGGVVFPLVVQHLLPQIGYAWTLRVLALIMAIVIIISNIILRPRLPPRAPGPLVEWAAYNEMPFTLYSIGAFLFFWGLYFSFFYLSDYANYVGLTRNQAFLLTIIQNCIGIAGRLIPNFLADRVGPMNILIPFIFMTGIMYLVWIKITTYSGLIAYAIVCGFFNAGVQGLFPATAASLTTDLSKTGIRIGMIFTIISFATLTGPPIGGALLLPVRVPNQGDRYLHSQIFAGLAVISGGIVVCLARFFKVGARLKVKV